jgi:single-strand DNA-binding protein
MSPKLADYLKTGKQVGVEGKIRQDRWQDDTGNNKNRVYIFFTRLVLLGGKSGDAQRNSTPPAEDQPAAAPAYDYGQVPF